VVAVGDDRLLEMALIENLQREDLNPVELAQAYRQLMDVKGWTQDTLAQSLGLSRPAVSNTIRVLELPEDMQNALIRGQISLGHSKVLLSISDPREQRLLFEKIAEEKLTVRDLEGAAETARVESGDGKRSEGKTRRPRGGALKSPQVVSLEEHLSEKLGTRVRIREKAGRGRITIEFYSSEDFERIRSHFC
jgi:ParB family chromosome partitioning protein